MTESEARSKIKYRIGVIKEIAGNRYDVKFCEDLEIAIQALKEIREYRAVGTVEELQALRNASELWEHNNNLAYKQGRIDAIDEFVKELDECCGWEKGCVESLEVTRTTYLQVAEYLKEGATDEG